MPLSLKQFYRGKSTPATSYLFDYDDQGNLIEKDKTGKIINTISLPTYRRPTNDEMNTLNQSRKDAIQKAIENYDRIRTELSEEYQKKDQKDHNRIHELNREVEQADIQLQKARFPMRFVEYHEKISIKSIDFSKPNETRKTYNVAIMHTTPFTIQDIHVRVGAPAQKPMVSVAEATAKKADNVILFGGASDLEYGMFSLNWEVEIEFKSPSDGKSTMYHSATQAILAEMAKSFQDQTNLDQIMAAMTPESIQYSVENVPGDRDANEIRWKSLYEKLLYDVNLAKFTQYPALASQLLQTGTARLGALEPKDNQFSIGLSSDDSRAKNPAFWTGQNIFGVVLMKVRDYVRSQQPVQTTQVGTTSVSKTKMKRPKAGDKEKVVDATAPPVPVSIREEPIVGLPQPALIQPSEMPSLPQQVNMIPPMNVVPPMNVAPQMNVVPPQQQLQGGDIPIQIQLPRTIRRKP